MLVSTYDASKIHMMCLATLCRQVAAVTTNLSHAPECSASAMLDEMRSRHSQIPQALEGAIVRCQAACKARVAASLNRDINCLRRLNPEALRAATNLRAELRKCVG